MQYVEINNPAHPGEIVLEDILPHYHLSITDAAQVLKITRPNLSNVLNGKSAMSPELAAKIENAFGVSAELLLSMMANWSLSRARSDAGVQSVHRLPEPA